MGGPAGVEAGEINRLTLQPGTGLWMNAVPRASMHLADMVANAASPNEDK